MSSKVKFLLALALVVVAYKMFASGPSAEVDVEYEESDA
jgi:hypothetical protein